MRTVRLRCRSTQFRASRDRFALSSFRQPRPDMRGGETTMLQSHVIEIDGAFVGAAVRQTGGYRFVAIDVRLDDLDGRVWPTMAELRRNVRVMVLAGRGPVRPQPAAGCRA
jgi:hypothetical protein